MNEPQAPFPPAPPSPPAASPPPAPPKKGLPPLAWVAIGCGALILIAVLVLMVGGYFVASKVKEVAEDFEENPTIAAAEMVVRLNPDLELVESDREAGRIKVRDKKSGEVYVLDAQEVSEGRISFGKEGEEATMTFGEEGMTVEGPEGESFRAGTADLEDLPDWVPVVAGATAEGSFTSSTAEGHQGTYSLKSDESLEEVVAFYEEELEDAGFEVEKTSYSAAGVQGTSLTGRSPDGRRSLTVMVTAGEDGTQVVLQYGEEG